MKRYHVKIFRPENTDQKLQNFNEALQYLEYRPTQHCLDNLKDRVDNIKALLYHLKSYCLNSQEIFEHYENDHGIIIKACYRISWESGQDLILVIGHYKQIITIYLNDSDDNHITLKPELYNKS